MMVYSIIVSLKSLLWAIVLLTLVNYVFAIYMTESVTEYRRKGTGRGELTERQEEFFTLYFGSLFTTMYTLFQCITGGANWGYVLDPLVAAHWSYAALMSLFVAFTSLAVLNIVTAVFVESAMQSAQQDADLVIQL